MDKWATVALLIGAWIVLKWVIALSMWKSIRRTYSTQELEAPKHFPPGVVELMLGGRPDPRGRIAAMKLVGSAGHMAFWLAVLVALFG